LRRGSDRPDTAQNPELPQVEPGTRAPYELADGDRVCFVVENASSVALSVTLLDCAPSGRVLLLGEKRIPRLSRHVFWYGDTLGSPFVASLPDNRPIGVERIAAIATTRPDVSLRYLERRQSFADVMSPPGSVRPAVSEVRGATEPSPKSWTPALTSGTDHPPSARGSRANLMPFGRAEQTPWTSEAERARSARGQLRCSIRVLPASCRCYLTTRRPSTRVAVAGSFRSVRQVGWLK
jgi:hypothetical protein